MGRGVMAGLEPLRRGAVFLCAGRIRHDLLRRLVSNPFAAGRCSSVRLGAEPSGVTTTVSNPFAAGRCSSAEAKLYRVVQPEPRSRTPSPRGGVPLLIWRRVGWYDRLRLEPLRRGAVFLWRGRSRLFTMAFSSRTPSPRGGVPLLPGGEVRWWLVRLSRTPSPRGGVPLFPITTTSKLIQASLEPLRRGAVFLWQWPSCGVLHITGVSNPFAAGRCSSEDGHP